MNQKKSRIVEFVFDERSLTSLEDMTQIEPHLHGQEYVTWLQSEASMKALYQVRIEAFREFAKTLPEPYRTQAYDILANGKVADWRQPEAD